MTITYRDAGVDISRIRQTHKEIGRMIESTHVVPGARTAHGFGHYAGVVEIPGGNLLATHTDGVGTKVVVACMMKKYDTIGIDCIAMNVNDIICIGARPVSFVDYIAANRDSKAAFRQIMKGLVDGARRSMVPIVGGETAIMPDVIEGDGFAFDLAGMVAGLVSRDDMILGDRIAPGDVIIGASSTGIHSNGYSLARRVLIPKYSLGDRIRGEGTIGGMLLEPTRIYVEPVLEIARECGVSGLAHVTGGSFTKLLRLKKARYVIDHLPKTPAIMGLIEEQGVSPREMYRTFNMGVGFCVIAPGDQAPGIQSIFKRHGMESQEIGHVAEGNGVHVNSAKIA